MIVTKEGMKFSQSPEADIEIADEKTFICKSGTLYLTEPYTVGISAGPDATVIASAENTKVVLRDRKAKGFVAHAMAMMVTDYPKAEKANTGSSTGVSGASKNQSMQQLQPQRR